MAAPVIITGCARSGTTLLARLLGAHDKLHYNTEGKFLRGLYDFWESPRSLTGLKFNGVDNATVLRYLGDFAENLYESAHCPKHNARIIDKSPDYYDILPWITDLFYPDTRIIVVVRHGLDVASSLHEEMAPGGAGGFIDDVAKPWIREHGGGLAGACRWWHHVNQTIFESDADFMTVKYERLLEDPIAEVEACLEYLGIEVEPSHTHELLKGAFEAPHPAGWGDRKFRKTRTIEPSRAYKWQKWPADKVVRVAHIVRPMLTRVKYPAEMVP